jgi:hypothetical protein
MRVSKGRNWKEGTGRKELDTHQSSLSVLEVAGCDMLTQVVFQQ